MVTEQQYCPWMLIQSWNWALHTFGALFCGLGHKVRSSITYKRPTGLRLSSTLQQRRHISWYPPVNITWLMGPIKCLTCQIKLNKTFQSLIYILPPSHHFSTFHFSGYLQHILQFYNALWNWISQMLKFWNLSWECSSRKINFRKTHAHFVHYILQFLCKLNSTT